MRRIALLAAAAALAVSTLTPATAGAVPPVPSMTATACFVADTMRVTVTWSSLAATGGEIFVDTIPPSIDLRAAWNQKGKHGTHTEEFLIAGRVIDSVIVNLYNAKIPGFFEQRQLGDDDEVAFQLPPC